MYAIAHIIHLFCAILFVGGVLFEALILSVLHTQRVSREARREVERAVMSRAVRVMPWAVAGVFLSGLVMVYLRYIPVLSNPFASSFGAQLTLKIGLAASVLVHFIAAVSRMKRQTMTAAFSRYIHRAVLLHMLLIVLLAKTLFYINW